jgi:cation diffusion facilitator CzcD-associated flavoprotein CzcO
LSRCFEKTLHQNPTRSLKVIALMENIIPHTGEGPPRHPRTCDYDVIIIGAGISGINAAYRVQTQAPKGTTYTILESRARIGGTWDLFKYPGLRSDSDLYTFGFPWRPWTDGPAIAEAPLILEYLKGAVHDTGIDKSIKFNHKVTGMDWSSENLHWALTVEADGGAKQLNGRFVVFATGYYDYETPLQTVIPGLENFQGKVIHPQFWPEDLDYAGKEVAIIGSGATAITIHPVIAETAKRTTIVQRSPTYILPAQNKDSALTQGLRRLSPVLAAKVNRIRFLVFGYFLFYFSRMFPSTARKLIRGITTKELPASIPHDPHFNPSYNPWEQRLCVTPNGEFFRAMREGKGGIMTGNINTVTKNSIVLESGEELSADIIVTATGLKLKVAGGIPITIDQQPYDISTKYMWKGMLLHDLPNAALVLGYTNASWTLGADATAQTLTRLLVEMTRRGARAVIPRVDDAEKMSPKPVLNLNSTYIKRGKSVLPMTGDRGPWKPRTNYFTDLREAKWGSIQNGLEYVT